MTSDTIRVLDERARRRQRSDIASAAIEADLSPDSAEAGEAAAFRRLVRMSLQRGWLERDVAIADEAIGLLVERLGRRSRQPCRRWRIERAGAKGQERHMSFVDLLWRGISEGRL